MGPEKVEMTSQDPQWNAKPPVKRSNMNWGVLAVIVAAIVLAGFFFSKSSPPSSVPDNGGAGSYQEEYGGSASVYAQIAADTGCASLQTTFDRAAANNDLAEPGTDQHRWTTGYMTAADARMQELGCY